MTTADREWLRLLRGAVRDAAKELPKIPYSPMLEGPLDFEAVLRRRFERYFLAQEARDCRRFWFGDGKAVPLGILRLGGPA